MSNGSGKIFNVFFLDRKGSVLYAINAGPGGLLAWKEIFSREDFIIFERS